MHTPPSAADGHSRRPGQAPTGAQEEPGTAGLCTRLELWALEAEGLSLLPSQHFSVGSRSCFPGTEQRCGQCPWGLGTCSRSSHTLRGSALPATPARGSPWEWLWAGGWTSLPSLKGLSAPIPPSALWHRGELRALTTPARLPHWGSPSTRVRLPPAPEPAPAGHTGPGVEASIFIPDWGGRVGAWSELGELRSGAGPGVPLALMALGWCRRLPGCCRTRLIFLSFFFILLFWIFFFY